MREIGASAASDEVGCAAARSSHQLAAGDRRAETAGGRRASTPCVTYFNQLKKNANQGSRVDSGTDELGLAFLIDDDLAAILSELDPSIRLRSDCSRARSTTSSIIPSCCPGSNRPPACSRGSSD